MKIFKNRNTFIFNYSIHLVFFFCLLLCPSFPRCRFFRFLLDYDLCYNPLSSSCFVVNAQQQNLFLQIVAGNGTNGYNGDNRPAATTQLNLGSGGGVYEDSNGVLYVGDLDNYRLRKIDFQGIITTIAGTGTLGTSGASGAGTSISIGYPRYIAADTMGSYLYFSDNYYVWKYQISNGILSRYAGVAPLSQGSSGDGQQASAARFYANVGISLSTLGLLYISDHGNNRVRVVAVNGIVTTFAGSGPDAAAGSYGGDGGSAVSSSCKLYGPFGVYVDTVGSVFIVDLYNARVRKVDTFGIIRTFAGGGSGGDGGQGTSAALSNAYDVKGDRLGNMYITGGCAVRIVNTAGIINTIIGTGTCGTTLTFLVSASSSISSVYGLWVNSNFDLYTAESAGLVRKTVNLLPSSQPSSHPSSSYNVEHQNLFLQVVAGNGTNGYNGDNRPATTAQVNLVGGGVYGDSNGVLYISENSNFRLRRIDLQGIITTIAGTGTAGSSGGSGAGTSVNIAYPRNIAGDTMGSYLYFSDYYYVWKYQKSNGILSRYAGALSVAGYSGDGQQATAAQFSSIAGVSLSTLGLLYIADRSNHRIRVVAVSGIVVTFAGSGPDGPAVGSYGGDGESAIATNCKLYHPWGVYADTIGNVFIADVENSRIRKVDSFGIIRTFAGGGSGGDDAPATAASLTNAYDVKGDRLGNLYIADACTVRVVNTAGIINTIIGTGTCGTTLTFSAATSSPISFVYGLWVNSNFDVYTAESGGLVHKTVDVLPTSQPSSHPSSSCNVEHQNLFLQVVAGNGTNGYNGDNRPATTAQVNLAEGGAYADSNGVIYIGDNQNHRLRKIDLQGIITTIAGTGTVGSSGASGAGTSVSVGYPRHIAGDTMGSYLYFSDFYYVWKYQISNGILSRYAGALSVAGYSGDGQQATAAQFFSISGISLSTLGLLYISDRANNRVRVVAVNGIITTFAGSGPDGPAAGSYGGDGGLAVSTSCKLYRPYGVYADTVGNVFIADYYNTRVRKVDSLGIIRTFAGGGSGGDGGPATTASLSDVYDVKGDRLGNIYITSGCKIRMVNIAGIINTIIGTGTCGITLTFSAATSSPVSYVYGLWVNSNFEVYTTEGGGLVHKTVDVLPTSQPSSHPSSSYNVEHRNLFLQVVAGNGTHGYNGDNRPATTAQVNINEGGISGDSSGVLYIGDHDNSRLRKIDLQGIITTIAGTGTVGSSGGSAAGTSISIAHPHYIAADTMGSYLYFTDEYYVWKYQISNGILSRYAGVAPFSQGFSGDGQQATAAQFYVTLGVSLSTLGLLYISDHNNNRVRVVAVNGIITTFAGSGPDGPAAGSYGGDGGLAVSTNCKLYSPWGVYADTVGNVFIADYYNVRVRKVDSFGIIRTFAGGGTGGDAGPATSASLTNVFDVKGDRLGNIYITSGCKIRKVNTAGIINTIIGTGACAPTLTFSAVTSSTLSSVYALWVSSNFNVYFTESAGLIHKTVSVPFPTSQPSRCPSSEPSSQPLPLPSTPPSSRPSSQPYSRPSCQPSSRPSSSPYSRPSAQPSSHPSARPYSRPSAQPSSHPSACPYSRPSTQPSSCPSVQPSTAPSSCPSVQPSTAPSSRPSVQPSTAPSRCPSVQPSTAPSSCPSVQPSAVPSGCPSVQPSTAPSTCPSVQPSTAPSCGPSLLPSTVPSSCPSVQPSRAPSSCPSVQPSTAPKKFPTVQPTTAPTTCPSVQPSTAPSSCPSVQPSTAPSRCPSVQPSTVPSCCPSVQPSTAPSRCPSVQPSTAPSSSPSVQPSTAPSSCPSVQPSTAPSSYPSVQPSTAPIFLSKCSAFDRTIFLSKCSAFDCTITLSKCSAFDCTIMWSKSSAFDCAIVLSKCSAFDSTIFFSKYSAFDGAIMLSKCSAFDRAVF
jgi:hypothetical protein